MPKNITELLNRLNKEIEKGEAGKACQTVREINILVMWEDRAKTYADALNHCVRSMDENNFDDLISVIMFLTSSGADASLPDSFNTYPLQTAIDVSKVRYSPVIAELVDKLLNAGANKTLHFRDGNDDTPLFSSLFLGKPYATRVLLEWGADPNETYDQGGNNPLCQTVYLLSEEFVDTLLEFGARGYFRAKNGPLALAVLKLFDAAEDKYPLISRICQKLLSAGASLEETLVYNQKEYLVKDVLVNYGMFEALSS